MVKQATAELKRKTKKLSEQCSPGTARGIRLKQNTHTPAADTQKKQSVDSSLFFLARFAEQNKIAAVPETMGSSIICTENNKENPTRDYASCVAAHPPPCRILTLC